MSKASSAAERRFDLSARLPDQVFKGPAELAFLFADSALLTAGEGWRLLKACARRFSDDQISAVVVEDMAGVRASTTPVLEIEPESPRELFINWLDQEESESGSPLYVDARVLAFAGVSWQWGVWIDQDRELAVLGAPIHALSTIAASTLPKFSWLPAREVADLLAPSFYPDPVSPELLERLNHAYGKSSLAKPNP